MSTTTTYTGVRIVDMPDLGAVTSGSSVVGEHAGSGRFGMPAISSYLLNFAATGATASRYEPDRWGDLYSVKDFGAVLDGVTDDSAAFIAAYNATPDRGTIHVPPGGFNIPGFNVANSTKCLLWKLNGNTYGGSGSVLVGGFGNSVVETLTANATKYFGRLNSTGMETSVGAVLRADMTVTHAGGATGGLAALDINASTTAVSTPNQAPYAISGRLTMRSTQVGGGVGCGVFGSAVRTIGAGNATAFGSNFIADDQSMLSSVTNGGAIGTEIDLKANFLDDGVQADGYSFAPYNRLAIASMTWSAGVVTVTTAAPHGMSASGFPSLQIQSVVPSGYNGNFYCDITGASTFTYPQASNPGAVTTQGTWNAYFIGSQRAVLTVQYGRSNRSDTNQMQVSNLLGLGYFSEAVDQAYCSAKCGLTLHGRVSFAGINLTHMVNDGSAQAIAMQDGQSISWTPDANTNDPTTSVPPTHWSSLQYRAATSRLYYVVNGVDMWSVDASGNVRAKGTLTGSTTP